MIEHVVVTAATPSRKMEPLTRTRPKAMLPILGTPMIAKVMDGYYNAGIRRFTVVVGEQEGELAAWLSTRWHQDVTLRFAPRGHQRGTASALYAARSMLDSPFLIAPCDYLIPEEHVGKLATYFESHPGDVAVLSIFYAPDDVVQAAGVFLDPRGNVMFISDTPTGAHQDNMIALPVYAFTPAVLAYLDKVPLIEESGERGLASAIQLMIDDGQVVGALETGWRIRLDEPQDLLTAAILLMAGYSSSVISSTIPDTTHVIPPVHIDSGVVLGANVTIGPNVYLETGTVIGPKARLAESIVLARRIGGGLSIEREVISQDKT